MLAVAEGRKEKTYAMVEIGAMARKRTGETPGKGGQVEGEK